MLPGLPKSGHEPVVLHAYVGLLNVRPVISADTVNELPGVTLVDGPTFTGITLPIVGAIVVVIEVDTDVEVGRLVDTEVVRAVVLEVDTFIDVVGTLVVVVILVVFTGIVVVGGTVVVGGIVVTFMVVVTEVLIDVVVFVALTACALIFDRLAMPSNATANRRNTNLL